MILHILAPGPVGGLESVVRLLARGQAARGHAVAAALVLDAGTGEHPLEAPLRAAGVAVHPLPIPLRAYQQERRELAALLARLAPDVVHSHGYRTDVLATPLARARGIPVVTTVHGFTGGGWKNRLYEWLQVRSFRRADAVIAVSRPLVGRLAALGVPAARIHLIRNAFQPEGEPPYSRREARQALGLAPDAFVLGWVGRLSHEKGADVLVRALAHLRDLPLEVALIGDGRERGALEALAAELGVAERIRWLGRVADAGRHFAAFDGYVLSSRTEGTPMVLFEAMTAGVPIVAARVGGVPDVVGDAEALLVPPEAPEPLAGALRALRADAGAAQARTAAARARLGSEFAPGPWLDRHDALYRTLVDAAATRRVALDSFRRTRT
ncbi:MAG TPA: glycosyltransferase [Gemmatimonadales bacterium]|nr:glycosyltransferase [Gemmatimonadales bacterium]